MSRSASGWPIPPEIVDEKDPKGEITYGAPAAPRTTALVIIVERKARCMCDMVQRKFQS